MPHRYAALDRETVLEIRRQYLDGEKTEVICLDLGIGPETLMKYVADLPRRRPHQEAKRLAAIDLSAQGKDVRSIAKELDMPIRSVVLALAPCPVPRDPLAKAGS